MKGLCSYFSKIWKFFEVVQLHALERCLTWENQKITKKTRQENAKSAENWVSWRTFWFNFLRTSYTYKVSISKPPPSFVGGERKNTIFFKKLIFFRFCPESNKKLIFFVKNKAKKCKKNHFLILVWKKYEFVFENLQKNHFFMRIRAKMKKIRKVWNWGQKWKK